MHLIRPFAGLRPAAGQAADVAAPPYDVLTTEEARVRATGKPWSFLHISKPEIDLPPGTDPYAPQVYAKAAENLRRMLVQKVLGRDPKPCYYAYRLIMEGRAQTGLVAAACVADYDSNRIRKHEFTRPDKEDDRVRQIEALNAQTGPVLLAYPNAPDVDTLLAEVTRGEPVADVTADTGVRHSLWPIEDTAHSGQADAGIRCDAGALHRRWPSPLGRGVACRRVAPRRQSEAYRYGELQFFPGGCVSASSDAHPAVQPRGNRPERTQPGRNFCRKSVRALRCMPVPVR